MSKIKTGSNAQFTSAGKGLTMIGEHCYSFSGSVDVDGNETELLNFNTGKDYIIAKIQFGLKHDTSDNLVFGVKINGLLVAGYAITGGIADAQLSNYMPILIPPLSEVITTGQNSTDSSVIPIMCWLTGRVYDG